MTTLTLNDYMPKVLTMPEADVLKQYQLLVGTKVWAPLDLTDWLEEQGLDQYNAEYYTDALTDYMLENGLGEEYGGLTPWCGEGYYLYEDC